MIGNNYNVLPYTYKQQQQTTSYLFGFDIRYLLTYSLKSERRFKYGCQNDKQQNSSLKVF